jgi:hypothetical protein
MELRFEDGGEKVFQALLSHSIPYRWDTQQTLATTVFRDNDPPCRLWLIAFGFEFEEKLCKFIIQI